MCPSCGDEVTIRFLRPGELYKCKCGKTSIVPQDATEVFETIDAAASYPESGGTVINPPRPGEPATGLGEVIGGAGVFTLLAYGANGALVLFSLIGLAVIGVTFVNIIGLAIPYGASAVSVFALTKGGSNWRGLAIAANVLAFEIGGLVNAFVGKSMEARVGGWIYVGIGIINLIALSLRNKKTFLGLYLERKRLEEAKRVAELDRELNERKPA